MKKTIFALIAAVHMRLWVMRVALFVISLQALPACLSLTLSGRSEDDPDSADTGSVEASSLKADAGGPYYIAEGDSISLEAAASSGTDSDLRTEPPRISRRLPKLREWSHGKAKEVFTSRGSWTQLTEPLENTGRFTGRKTLCQRK